jgi:phosphatidylinositol-3-phosphatase
MGLWFACTSHFAAAAPFTAFNDHVPGLGTASNVSTFGPGQSGPLTDFVTGSSLPVRVNVTAAANPNTIQGRPFYGTPASVVFDGIVDLAGYPFPALEMSGTTGLVTYTFTGLDPAKEYNFQGTAIRGNINYGTRWTVFELVGADSFTNRHSAGAVTRAQVGSLLDSQVAINTGDNAQGLLAWWEHIQPGPDGSFAVMSRRYTGSLPGGGTASGAIAYGLTGFRLEEGGVYSGRTNPPPRVPGHSDGGINGIQTVWVVVMENSDWSRIKGSTNCPYINNTLLPQAAWCERYYNPPGLHPSLPNYLWLLAGTNFGIQDDALPSVNHQNSTNTLFHQLDAAGISWRCYAEGVTGTGCPATIVGDYAPRHVPFLYFDSVLNNVTNCTNHIRPYPEIGRDLTNGNVARFNFLVPNRTNDMHDPTTDRPAAIRQGDAWLAAEMPKILNSSAYQAGGLLIVTFDEGDGSTGDGPIGTIFLSARVKHAGYASSNFFDHSSLLRTWQDIFGVGPYLGGAAYANDLSDIFKTIRISSVGSDGAGLHVTVTNLIAGRTNHVLFSNTLEGPWQTVETNIATASGQAVNLAMTNATGFYRIRELP